MDREHLQRPIGSVGVTSAFGHGWHVLWSRPLQVFVIAVVYAAIEIGLSVVSGLVGGEGVGALLSLALGIAVSLPLGVGFAFAMLRLVRGDPLAGIADLFVPFQGFWLRSIGATLLTVVAVLVGLIFLILPGIYIGLRLMFVSYIVIDRGLGPVEAVTASWRLTSGRTLTLLGFICLGLVIAAGGLLLFVIGLIPAVLWITLSQASLYAALDRDEVLPDEQYTPLNPA